MVVPMNIMLIPYLFRLLTLPSCFHLLRVLLLPWRKMLHHDAILLMVLKVRAYVLFVLRLCVPIKGLLLMLDVEVSLSWRWRYTFLLTFNRLSSLLSSSLIVEALFILEHFIQLSCSFLCFLKPSI
jgi:hypothetical protein